MHSAELYIRENMVEIKKNNTYVANTKIASELLRDLRYSLWHGFIDQDTYYELKTEITLLVDDYREEQLLALERISRRTSQI